MTAWTTTIDLRDIFETKEDHSFRENKHDIVERIRDGLRFWEDDDLETVMVGLRTAATLRAFNESLTDFYYWADLNHVRVHVWVEPTQLDILKSMLH
jgi:hypothetical protein